MKGKTESTVDRNAGLPLLIYLQGASSGMKDADDPWDHSTSLLSNTCRFKAFKPLDV